MDRKKAFFWGGGGRLNFDPVRLLLSARLMSRGTVFFSHNKTATAHNLHILCYFSLWLSVMFFWWVITVTISLLLRYFPVFFQPDEWWHILVVVHPLQPWIMMCWTEAETFTREGKKMVAIVTQDLFTYLPNSKFLHSLSVTLIFRRMHEALNVGKK
jgi:hypothetical protein